MGDWQDLPLTVTEGRSPSLFESRAQLDNLMLVKNPAGSLRPYAIMNTPALVSHNGATASTAMQGLATVLDASGNANFWYIADGELRLDNGASTNQDLGAISGLTLSGLALCKIVPTGINAAVIVSPRDQAAWYCVWNGVIGGGSSLTVTAISLPAGNIIDATWQDGYTIYLRALTDEWYISALDDPTTIGALDFTTIDAEQDVGFGVVSANRELIVFGRHHIEFYYDSGNASFPFTRQQPGVARPGTADGRSIAQLDGVVYFLGSDNRVYRLAGYTAEAISDPWTEGTFPSGTSSTSCVFGATYVDRGQRFYVLSFQGSTLGSYVYSIDTGTWHTRSHTPGGGTSCYTHSGIAYNLGVVFIAANLSTGGGGLYKYSTTSFRDGSGSADTKRTITLPSFEAGGRRVFESDVRLDIERTTGVAGTVQYDYQDESTGSFVGHGAASATADGDATTSLSTDQDLIAWHRCGAYRRRAHRFRILANARIAINAAQHRFEVGT